MYRAEMHWRPIIKLPGHPCLRRPQLISVVELIISWSLSAISHSFIELLDRSPIEAKRSVLRELLLRINAAVQESCGRSQRGPCHADPIQYTCNYPPVRSEKGKEREKEEGWTCKCLPSLGIGDSR
ncbi:hypothetical protein GQ55_1G426900 [Panicum hallii var. hallii]|uniref:Uncharacterized protein n=1 Tax=Panicum hallii var. hallii TaxID=1504633 RepID=A0A2T7FDH7_9POAL|nr:hypothetical protein GQ55_1G426900 [Panicum hallii var. hallii]